jgi:hypothetical protein
MKPTLARLSLCAVLFVTSWQGSVIAEEATSRLVFDATSGLVAPQWQKSGEIEAIAITDGEISALDFNDDSTTAGLTYTASFKPMAAALQSGFEMEFNSKLVSGGAHAISLMLPSSRIMLQLSANDKEQTLTYAANGKGGEVRVPVGAFHKWKIVYTPPAAGAEATNYGTYEIYLDGEKKVGELGALRGNGQTVLALGSINPYIPPDRVGRVLIQSFELRPSAKP